MALPSFLRLTLSSRRVPVSLHFHACYLFVTPAQEALALLQPALLKDAAPLKFSQFVSDRGTRCLIDLGLMSIIQDAAKNKKLTVQREGAMEVLASLSSVVGRTGAFPSIHIIPFVVSHVDPNDEI